MEDPWIDCELAGCRLGDERLDKRLRLLVERMDGAMGESIPLACQDWANTKAAYRFFSNERVSEGEILRGPFRGDAKPVRRHQGSDPRPPGHDRVFLSKKTAGGRGLHQPGEQREGQVGS